MSATAAHQGEALHCLILDRKTVRSPLCDVPVVFLRTVDINDARTFTVFVAFDMDVGRNTVVSNSQEKTLAIAQCS